MVFTKNTVGGVIDYARPNYSPVRHLYDTHVSSARAVTSHYPNEGQSAQMSALDERVERLMRVPRWRSG